MAAVEVAGPEETTYIKESSLGVLMSQESFYESLSALIVPLLLLAAGLGFSLLVFDEENVLLMKHNQFRITQARDEQVEDEQHQSMKRCSHKELDKER